MTEQQTATCVRDGCNNKIELSPAMVKRIKEGTVGFPCDTCRKAMVNIEVARKLSRK